MTLVPTARFDTDLIEEQFRFEAWRQMLSASHDVDSADPDFHGRMHSTRLGEMVVHVMQSSPLATERTARKTRLDGLEHFVLHINPISARVEADGRELTVPPSGISINDLAKTSRREMVPEANSILVSLSRELVRERSAIQTHSMARLLKKALELCLPLIFASSQDWRRRLS